MKTTHLYTADDINKTYEQVHDLLLTRYIIKTYSTNKSDIRDIALNGLNLKNVKRVLDIGCGYGFFVEKLKGMLDDGAIIIGIDMVENNREPFLHSVASIQYKGEYITGNADVITNMAKSSFDLIITSYSLYFFPNLMREISRILAPHGIFIAVTHSKNTLQEVLGIINTCMERLNIKTMEKTLISRLFLAFSREEGKVQLENHFKRVEQIDFMNSLIFPHEYIEDCIFYIEKKKNLIYKEVLERSPNKFEAMRRCVELNIAEISKNNGVLTINKDDAVFRCYGPNGKQ